MKRTLFLYAAVLAAALFSGAVLAEAQTISVVSGNGQVVQQSFPIQEPLVVIVRDTAGNPVQGAIVNWAVIGQGTLVQSATVTDNTGTTSNVSFLGAVVLQGTSSYVQSTITATSFGQTANFTVTSYGTDTNGSIQVQAFLGAPANSERLVGPAGSTNTTTPIRVNVRAIAGLQSGQGIPNVYVRAVATDATSGPKISCSTTVLTDSLGNAVCNATFSGTPGDGRYNVKVGGWTEFQNLPFTVTVGQPSSIVLSSGSNQSGNPGQLLAAPLVAQVQDSAGNSLSGIGVTWSVLNAGGAVLTNSSTSSDANGRVSTSVTLGSVPGATSIRVAVTSTPSIAYTFTVNTNIVVGGIQAISGSGQDAIVGTNYANPLVVQANDSQGRPITGQQVTFVVTQGLATVTSPVLTNAQGQAVATVTAGNTPGNVTVTATAGTFTATFNLTVRLPGPVVSTASFFNGAGNQQGYLSPGSLAVISGAGLAPGIQGEVRGAPIVGPWPIQVANVSVQFGSVFAPIYNVANIGGREYVTIQVPFEVSPGPATVTVRVGSASTVVNGVNVGAASPGIFEAPGSDNRRRAVLIGADGRFISLQQPARKGEIVKMFVTGVGPGSPAIASNSVGIGGADAGLAYQLIAGIGPNGIRVVSGSYTPDIISVAVISVEVPVDAPSGDQLLGLGVIVPGQVSALYSNGSIIPIQ